MRHSLRAVRACSRGERRWACRGAHGESPAERAARPRAREWCATRRPDLRRHPGCTPGFVVSTSARLGHAEPGAREWDPRPRDTRQYPQARGQRRGHRGRNRSRAGPGTPTTRYYVLQNGPGRGGSRQRATAGSGAQGKQAWCPRSLGCPSAVPSRGNYEGRAVAGGTGEELDDVAPPGVVSQGNFVFEEKCHPSLHGCQLGKEDRNNSACCPPSR